MGQERSIHPVVCAHCGMPLGNCGCGAQDYVLNREFEETTTTCEEVLRSFSQMFNQLTRESELLPIGDDTGNTLLRLRSQMLSQLPKVFRTTTDFLTVDRRLIEGVASIGEHAQEAIEYGPPGNFLESLLLIPYGAKVNDPNNLDRLISRYFPSDKA